MYDRQCIIGIDPFTLRVRWAGLVVVRVLPLLVAFLVLRSGALSVSTDRVFGGDTYWKERCHNLQRIHP